MVDQRVEITADDLEIDFVLDQYYTFLKRIIGNNNNRVLLFNTITPFDTYDFSPLYNENVFRNYANMIVSNSPLEVDPSSGVNLRDRFGYYYGRVVKEASSRVERKHLTADAKTEIADFENDIDALRDKRDRLEGQLADRWETHYLNLGLEPGSIEFELEKINYYNTSGIATQIADIFEDILTALSEIQEIKESVVPEKYRILIVLNNIIRSKEYKMFRPFRPTLEKDNELTHFELAKLLATARSVIGLRDIVEENEQILPYSDLGSIFKEGARGFKIEKGVADLERHDTDWSASASGSKFGVFKAKASASYVKKIKSSFESTNSIDIAFKNIDEFYVSRRDWYDSSIFEIDIVKEVVKENPKLAANTRNVVTSVIVGRGASVSFEFSEDSHYQEMKDIKTSVSGSASIGFISFGGGGHYHKYDFEQTNTDASKTITFGDGEDVCRILALKYDTIHSIGDDEAYERSFMLDGEMDQLLSLRNSQEK